MPVGTGAKPAADTPVAAARIQKSINALGLVNLLSGIGLVTSTGSFWRSALSHPPEHRPLRRSATTSKAAA